MNRTCRSLAPVLAATLLASAANAQEGGQFGIFSRASAADRAIVLGVQQGISSLPPTAGQSFVYELDSRLEIYRGVERLGPISLRAPETVGAGRLTVRGAFSYFELVDQENAFRPITYRFESDDGSGRTFFTKLGLGARSRVAVFNLAATAGLARRLDAFVNVPVVTQNADGAQIVTTRAENADAPEGNTPVAQAGSEEELERGLADGTFVFRRERFSKIPLVDFDDDHETGVGRISLGAKLLVWTGTRFAVAFLPELFLPSPHEEERAGSEGTSILPRLVGSLDLTRHLRAHADVGYEHDFDDARLSRLTWNAGASVAIRRLTLDAGIGGSEFDRPIRWTPSVVRAQTFQGSTSTGRIVRPGENELGTTYVDALAGAKLGLGSATALGASVTVPVNDDGFRGDVSVTASVDVSF